MGRITITVSFNEEKHAKHIAWVKRHPHGISAAVREAIAAQMSRGAAEACALDEIRAALYRLEIQGIVLRSDNGDEELDEPVEAALALDGLGI